MQETWEKKVVKFEREIPIGLDATMQRKKRQPPPPPNGIRVKILRKIILSAKSQKGAITIDFVQWWPSGSQWNIFKLF